MSAKLEAGLRQGATQERPASRAGLGKRLASASFDAAVTVLIVLVAFLVLYPVGAAVYRAFTIGGVVNLGGFWATLTAPWMPELLFTSLFTVAAGGSIAIVTASVFAWLNERTDARIGIVGDLLPLVPLLLPSVALAIGWVFLGSPTVGFLNAWLGPLFAAVGIPFRINIETWAGLIFVYSLVFVPYVYVLMAAALRNIDGALEEASRVSGAGLLMTMRRVSLPAVRPALVGAALLITMVGMSLYSIPAIMGPRAGVEILTVNIIQSMTKEYPPRTDQAVSLAAILLVLIFAMWSVHRRVTAGGHYAQISGKSNRQGRVELGRWKWIARTFMVLYLTVTSILPLVALLIVSLQPYWTPQINWSGLSLRHYHHVLFEKVITQNALRNSIFLSLAGAVALMAAAALFAAYMKRKPDAAFGRVIDRVTKLPAAFSHVIIGIGFLVAFSGPPFYLSGTLLMLFLVYLVLYLPEASIAAGSAFAQVGQDLIEASSVAGAGEGRTFRKVIVPLTLPGVVSGAALVFVLMVGELTASSLLAGVRFPVVGFVIFDIWDAGSFGQLAALATIKTAIAIGVIAIVFVFLQAYRKRHGLAGGGIRGS